MKLTKRSYILMGGILAVALSLAAAVRLAENTEEITLPAGTTIHVALAQTIASNQAESGDEFDATVAAPVMVNGKVVIPEGSGVVGHVVEARESGRLKGVARLRLTLDEVESYGDSYGVRTTAITLRGGNHKKRNWLIIGGSTAGGALIGGLAGGGAGAAIGGAAGAGAGTGVAAATGKKDIRIPAESVLRFRLTEPITVTVESES